MNSCLYEGWVRHRRLGAIENAFRYRVFQLYLDLEELDEVFRGRWLWSTRGFAPAWFRRADHLGDPALRLIDSVRETVEQATGRRPGGPVRLLTHLRYFGYGMNPVSFYYCFNEAGAKVESIVAEVHNTPWGERHCYTLSGRDNIGTRAEPLFRFRKSFHVSPFMDMDLDYEWRFSPPGENLTVHMENLEAGAKMFDATLSLHRRPIDGPNLARVLWMYPLMTQKVIAAIYWQALKLWWKGCRFYPHPKHRTVSEAKS